MKSPNQTPLFFTSDDNTMEPRVITMENNTIPFDYTGTLRDQCESYSD